MDPRRCALGSGGTDGCRCVDNHGTVVHDDNHGPVVHVDHVSGGGDTACQ